MMDPGTNWEPNMHSNSPENDELLGNIYIPHVSSVSIKDGRKEVMHLENLAI